MITVRILRRAISLVPGVLTVVILLSPAPGYEMPKNLAAAACFAVFVASNLIRSDGLHIVSLTGLGATLAISASQAGSLLSFALVATLLVLIDTTNVVKSLFGLTYPRTYEGDSANPSPYFSIVRKQVIRSSGLALATFMVSAAIVSTPVPLVTFSNPVSGSGILALATLLLIVLAASRGAHKR